MIELPEAQTLARQLSETVNGKTISQVIAGQSAHRFAWFQGEPAGYPALFAGKTVSDTYSVAGYVGLIAEDIHLMFHDGVNIRYLTAREVPPKKHQLYIQFDDQSQLVCTVQMYGGLYAFSEGEFDSPYYQVAREKPSPLSNEFDRAYFKNILNQKPDKLSIKALLATEQRILGLGNGCLQDIFLKQRSICKANYLH